MAFWNGLGGTIVRDPSGSAQSINVTKHVIRKTSRLAETTHSGNTATSFQEVIPHYEWEAEGVWDDANLVDTDLGMEEGDVETLKFNDGSSTKFVTLTGTTIESIEEVEDVVNDVIRWTMRGKGGTITRQVT